MSKQPILYLFIYFCAEKKYNKVSGGFGSWWWLCVAVTISRCPPVTSCLIHWTISWGVFFPIQCIDCKSLFFSCQLYLLLDSHDLISNALSDMETFFNYVFSSVLNHCIWGNFRGACHSPAWRMWNPRLVRNRLARYKNQSVSRTVCLPLTRLERIHGCWKIHTAQLYCARAHTLTCALSISCARAPLFSCSSRSWAELAVVKGLCFLCAVTSDV